MLRRPSELAALTGQVGSSTTPRDCQQTGGTGRLPLPGGGGPVIYFPVGENMNLSDEDILARLTAIEDFTVERKTINDSRDWDEGRAKF